MTEGGQGREGEVRRIGPRRHGDAGRRHAAFSSVRYVVAAGLCGVLAACSAHDRRSAPSAFNSPSNAGADQTADGDQTAAATGSVSDGELVAGIPLPVPRPAGQEIMTAAAAPAARDAKPHGHRPGKNGSGLASWYGDRFHGRPTANGERFSMAGFTAAHRKFPLPSYVRVTNASNGRSIVVRVNDRGPFHGARVIDVSKRAADVLGFRGAGVGTVSLDYIGPAPKDGSDDARLLASYQEFGRPSVAPGGMQVAALSPVSDADLAAEASQGGFGGAYAVASAAVVRSTAAVTSTVRATAEKAKAAVRTILPANAPPAVEVASRDSGVAASAYAPPQPLIASAPAEIVSPKSKRVVSPAAPALASSTPELGDSGPAGSRSSDISSRIASSFDSFGGGATSISVGGSVRTEITR